MIKDQVRLILVGFVAGAIVALGVNGWVSTSNYESCLLKNIDKAQTPNAANFVRLACAERYPKSK